MSTLQQEIFQRIGKLDEANQQRVLDFVIQLQNQPTLSALEVMKLPQDERQRYMMASIALAADEDFETFEAYSEETLSDKLSQCVMLLNPFPSDSPPNPPLFPI